MESVYRTGSGVDVHTAKRTDASLRVPALQSQTSEGNSACLASGELSKRPEAFAKTEARKPEVKGAIEVFDDSVWIVFQKASRKAS
jgi:hypothetical protein